MPCPEGMKTHHYLAQELSKLGLFEMAAKAREGYYHDFLSPIALPEMTLARDLQVAANTAKSFNDMNRYNKIMELRRLHISGEFDASPEESEEWANSPEGQEAFNQLIKGTEE